MDALRLGLAFVFKRQGSQPLTAATWAHVMSLELGWLSPGEAHGLVAKARGAGLLVGDGDLLTPGFIVQSASLPRNFRLPADVEFEPNPATEDPFLQWVENIGNGDRAAILAQVSARQDEYGGLLDAQAAVLQLAFEAGHDVQEAAATALKAIQDDAVESG